MVLLNTRISTLLYTKLAAATRLAEGQFLRAIENWVKFLIQRKGTLRLILSIKQGQGLDPEKKIMILHTVTQLLPWQRNFHGYFRSRSVITHVGLRSCHQTAAHPFLRQSLVFA